MNKAIFERTKQEVVDERDRLIAVKMDSVQNEFILPTYQKFEDEQNAAILAENERHTIALANIEKATQVKKQAYESEVRAEAMKSVEEANHFEKILKTLDELINE
nr:MAG TPA: hypothetical protein [Caudoviricetes sp.]